MESSTTNRFPVQWLQLHRHRRRRQRNDNHQPRSRIRSTNRHDLSWSFNRVSIPSSTFTASSCHQLKSFLEHILLDTTVSTGTKTATLLNSNIYDVLHADFYNHIVLHSYNKNNYDNYDDSQWLAATHLVQQMRAIRPYLQQHTNLPDSIHEHLASSLQEYLQPRLLSDTHLSLRHIAQRILWIEQHQDCLVEEWKTSQQEQLLQQYLQITQQQLQQQCQRVLQSDDDDEECRSNSKNNVFISTTTSRPEEVLGLLDAHMSVAREHLPIQLVKDVWKTCCQVIGEFLLGPWMVYMEDNYNKHNIATRLFCAWINDGVRLADALEERNEEWKSPQGDDLVQQCSQLSMHALQCLCKRIMATLKAPEQPILTSVGSPSWQRNDTENATIDCTIATLRDYFQDIEKWLTNEYFFSKVLKICFYETLQTYVESFFANTMLHGTKSPTKVAAVLEQDYERLAIFFNGKGFEDYNGRYGYCEAGEVNKRLHIIRCLSKLINPTIPPEIVAHEVQFFMKEVDPHGTVAVLHLAGLRRKHSSPEAIEWLRTIAHAVRATHVEKALAIRNYGASVRVKKGQPRWLKPKVGFDEPCIYKLPDLRNSKYLNYVRPDHPDLYRRISVASLALVEKTGGLAMSSKSYTQARVTLASTFVTKV